MSFPKIGFLVFGFEQLYCDVPKSKVTFTLLSEAALTEYVGEWLLSEFDFHFLSLFLHILLLRLCPLFFSPWPSCLFLDFVTKHFRIYRYFLLISLWIYIAGCDTHSELLVCYLFSLNLSFSLGEGIHGSHPATCRVTRASLSILCPWPCWISHPLCSFCAKSTVFKDNVTPKFVGFGFPSSVKSWLHNFLLAKEVSYAFKTDFKNIFFAFLVVLKNI